VIVSKVYDYTIFCLVNFVYMLPITTWARCT